MLVTRRLEVEALILILLTVLRAGVPIMRLYGKSRLRDSETFGRIVYPYQYIHILMGVSVGTKSRFVCSVHKRSANGKPMTVNLMADLEIRR
jgi:hypothetical protein